MELLREKFLKVYANIPLSLREDVALVIKENVGPQTDVPKALSWDVIYIEVRANSSRATELLEKLSQLDLI